MVQGCARRWCDRQWQVSPGMAILYGMAKPTVKVTYSLDVETVRVLERAAQRWGVSKSEALRRAIHAVTRQEADPRSALGALDELQAAAGLPPGPAKRWADAIRAERRAARATARKP